MSARRRRSASHSATSAWRRSDASCWRACSRASSADRDRPSRTGAWRPARRVLVHLLLGRLRRARKPPGQVRPDAEVVAGQQLQPLLVDAQGRQRPRPRRGRVEPLLHLLDARLDLPHRGLGRRESPDLGQHQRAIDELAEGGARGIAAPRGLDQAEGQGPLDVRFGDRLAGHHRQHAIDEFPRPRADGRQRQANRHGRRSGEHPRPGEPSCVPA